MRAGDLLSPRHTRAGAGRTLPLAVALTILVIVATGLAGTAHFTGARWFPRGSSAHHTPAPSGPLIKTPVPRRRRQFGGGGTGKIPLWVPIAAGLLLLAVIAAVILRWLRGRRLPAPPGLHAAAVQTTRAVPVEPEPEPEALLTGIALALRTLDEQRDPADAVVRAWLGLQETAEESGIVRLPAETPTEFTARIMKGAFADDRAIHTLLKLYLRTRFGDHPVTADDVTAVRAALQQLVSNWQQDAVS